MTGYSDEEIEATMQVGAYRRASVLQRALYCLECVLVTVLPFGLLASLCLATMLALNGLLLAAAMAYAVSYLAVAPYFLYLFKGKVST